MTWNARSGRNLLALSAIFFGGMAVATRAVSTEVGAAQIITVRFLVGIVGVAVFAAFNPRGIVATRPVLLLLRGLFGGAAVLGYFMAIERLSAGLGTLLNYTFPLWAALFAAIFLKERMSARLLAGFAVATTGLVTVIGFDEILGAIQGAGDPRIRIGLLAGLCSSVLAGVAVVTVRALRSTDSAMAIYGAFCVFGLLVVVPVALPEWRPITLRSGILLLLIGVLSLVAQFLFTYALRFVTAGAGSLTTQLTVVTSYAIAAITLGEPVSGRAAIGSLVVMGGVLLASLSSETGAAKQALPAEGDEATAEVRTG